MNARRGRAVVLIAVSLIVVAVAAGVYLAPQLAAMLPARPVPTPAALLTAPGENVSYTFATPSQGWAVASVSGDNRLRFYATNDGARSWILEDTIRVAPALTGYVHVRFFDAHRGVAVVSAQSGVLAYRTADGGRSWSAIGLPQDTWAVEFPDPNHGWSTTVASASGATHLLATDDGGKRWRQLPDPPAPGYPDFLVAREGWLAGPQGANIVYSTGDGGQTWIGHVLPESACAPATCMTDAKGGVGAIDVAALPGGGAIAASVTGQEFVTLDGGASWRFVVPPPEGGFAAIGYQDSTHWWVIGHNSLYKTANAGATWMLVSDRVAYDTLTPNVIDGKHAWAVLQTQDDNTPFGQRPRIGWELDISSDGGVSWHQAAVPVPD